jgi:recombination protein RecA
VDIIPSGLEDLDVGLLGCGGFPRARITEIYGSESSGKTTLALTVVSSAQKLGLTCAFIDVEHAIDPTWASKIGVDIDNLLISQPSSGEEALQIVQELVESEKVDLIVVDSVAALTPRSEIEGEIGDAVMGAQARLMGQAMRKINPLLSKSNTSLIFINQTRDKLGISFGSPTTTPGGKALKFYASVRLEVARIGSLKKGDEIIGNNVKIKVVKNKLAAPFKQAEFQLRFDSGFDIYGGILDKMIMDGEVTVKGAWFIIDGNKIQGREAALAVIKEKVNGKTDQT